MWDVLWRTKGGRVFAAASLLALFSGCGGAGTFAQCAPGLLSPILDPPERFQEGPEQDLGSARVGSRLVGFRVIANQLISEGDIVLGAASLLGGGDSRASSAITITERIWPGGVIPYRLDSNLPSPQRVNLAIEHWNARLGGKVRLIPQTSEGDWTLFARSASAGTCASSVGRQGGQQTVFVGDGCGTGNLIHEIGHLVGLWHEQNRDDRDRYVVIHWENVDPGQTAQFSLSGAWGQALGAYDYASIMHYPPDAFSKNGRPTVESVPGGTPIGQRLGLSAGDVAGAQALYGGDVNAVLAGCGF